MIDAQFVTIEMMKVFVRKKIENNNNNQNDNKYGFKKKNYSPTYKNDLDSIDNTLGFDENDYLSDYKNDLYNNDYDNIRGIFPEVSISDDKQNKCNPISKSILLQKKINPKGVILLADFDPCKIASGKVTLNMPNNPNLKLAAIYIDKNGNNHAGTLISPIKIENMDKKQGLFTIELNEKMKGKNPITGKSTTLTKINGLALYNNGDKAIKFKSGNIAELTVTFSK